MDFLKKNKNIIGIIGGILIIVGCFLDFVSSSVNGPFGLKSESTVKLIDYTNGKIVLILAFVGIILFLIKKIKLVVIPAILSLLITLLKYSDLTKVEKNIYSQIVSKITKTNPAIGFYVIIIGSIILFVPVILEFLDAKKNGSSIKEFIDVKEDLVSLTKKETYSEVTDKITGNKKEVNKFCANCGTKLESNSKFCPNCGKEV